MKRHAFNAGLRAPGPPPGNPRSAARGRAFTLVELLVVVIIIGILAAVAIPQFGDASTDAKVAALDQNLATVRSAIELYKYQHDGVYPGNSATHRDTGAGSAAPHANPGVAFYSQMTLYSNAAGDTCTEKSSSFPYGPYIRRMIPDNPFNVNPVYPAWSVHVVTDTTPLTADNSPTTGWKTSSATGEFIANNSAYASR